MNVRFWRKADIGQTEDEGPLLPKADIRPPNDHRIELITCQPLATLRRSALIYFLE
jgi:hypothetical protein